MVVERFAPSPTGLLHLGHAYSALVGWQAAQATGGQFLIRLEDLDTARCREEYADAIFRDLAWLDLTWEPRILRQSTRLEAYADALARLAALGLTYPCTCTRRDITEAIRAPQEASPVIGPDGPIYPGTCRKKSVADGLSHAIRLDLHRALDHLHGINGQMLCFSELDSTATGRAGEIAIDPDDLLANTGDIVLRRRDGAFAYHLAVVVDDAFQHVTHVTRAADLFPATPIHRVLQALLGLPAPTYRHHRLIRDTHGRRLAKRDDARAIAVYREQGQSPADVRALIGLNGHPV